MVGLPLADDLSALPPFRVTEEPLLAAELSGRVARLRHVRSVSVADLLSLRPAYWRRIAPRIPVPKERENRMREGRAWHARIGQALGSFGVPEVRVRRDGVSCRIDLLTEVPVEVKTGSFPPDLDLRRDRPEYVEQLGMYCGLLERDVGQLAFVSVGEGSPPTVTVQELGFRDLGSVGAEIRAREALWREATVHARPDALPRCAWRGRGCEYEAASLCDCTGNEPSPSGAIVDGPIEVRPRPDLSRSWTAALAGTEAWPVPGAERFRDLVYPRRAFFERTVGSTAVPEVPPGPPPAEPGLYDRLLDAIEGGIVGEVAQLPQAPWAPGEGVVAFRGQPLLVRTSRSWSRLRPDDVAARTPQYALELGLRCAAAQVPDGIAVVGYDRAESDADRLQVLEFRFDPLAPWEAEGRRRAAGLAEALDRSDPGELPSCPAWMVDGCAYRSTCGCGAGRSQR